MKGESAERPETEFQKWCRSRLIARLRSVERQFDLEEVVGEDENYLRILVASESRRLEVFIYEDEAGFFAGERWTIFEEPDFDSGQALCEAFFAALDTELARV